MLELRVLSLHLNLFETRLLKTKYNPHRRLTRTQTNANGRHIESKHIVDRLRTMTTNRDIQQKLPERKKRKPTHRNIQKKTYLITHLSYLNLEENQKRETHPENEHRKGNTLFYSSIYTQNNLFKFSIKFNYLITTKTKELKNLT